MDERAYLQEQITYHLDNNAKLTQRLTETLQCEAQVKYYIDNNAKLTEQLTKTEQSEAQLKDQVVSLQRTQQECQNRLEDISSELKEESELREEAEIDHKRLLPRHILALRERDAAVGKVTKLEQDVQFLQDDKKELQTKLEKSTKRELVLTNTIDGLRISNTKLEERAKKTKDEAKEELRPTYEGRIIKLRNDVEEANRQKRDAEAELVKAKEDRESCSQELRSVKEAHSQDLERFEETRKAKEKEFAGVQAENKRLTAYGPKNHDLQTKLNESKFTIHTLKRERDMANDKANYAQSQTEKQIESTQKWAKDWQNHVVSFVLGSPRTKRNVRKTGPEKTEVDRKNAKKTGSEKEADKKDTGKTGPEKKEAVHRHATSSGCDNRKVTTTTAPPDTLAIDQALTTDLKVDGRFSLVSRRRQNTTEEDNEIDVPFNESPCNLIDTPYFAKEDRRPKVYSIPPQQFSDIDSLCVQFKTLTLLSCPQGTSMGIPPADTNQGTDCESEASRILRQLKSIDPSLSFPAPGGNEPTTTSSAPVMPPSPSLHTPANVGLPTYHHQHSPNNESYIAIPSPSNHFNASPAQVSNPSPLPAPSQLPPQPPLQLLRITNLL